MPFNISEERRPRLVFGSNTMEIYSVSSFFHLYIRFEIPMALRWKKAASSETLLRIYLFMAVRGSNPGGGRNFPHPTRPALGTTHSPMDTGSFPGVKRTGRGVDHTPPSSTEVKEKIIMNTTNKMQLCRLIYYS